MGACVPFLTFMLSICLQLSRGFSSYAPIYMELSLEAYRIILKNVGSRADIATLCRVSRGFRQVSELALYNTIFMQNDYETILLCNTLASSPRLASLVDALTILLLECEEDDDDKSAGNDSAVGDGDDSYDNATTKVAAGDLPDGYWSFVAKAMEKLVHLRYLNVHINDGSPTSNAWILDSCSFNLQSFDCDFDWDEHLVSFLDRQTNLNDLCLLDYKNMVESTTITPPPRVDEEDEPTRPTTTTTALGDNCIPKLSILECNFSEAAIAIVPNRPITHLKTCFSRFHIADKRKEMKQLLTKVRLSTRPLISLDIADSCYTEEFSREFLLDIGSARSTLSELRYLGTLVLPVDGRKVRKGHFIFFFNQRLKTFNKKSFSATSILRFINAFSKNSMSRTPSFGMETSTIVTCRSQSSR